MPAAQWGGSVQAQAVSPPARPPSGGSREGQVGGGGTKDRNQGGGGEGQECLMTRPDTGSSLTSSSEAPDWQQT